MEINLDIKIVRVDRVVDERRVLEWREWSSGHDRDKLWTPCEHPERPIDINAARKHLIKGEPCRKCAIAYDADIQRRMRSLNGTEGASTQGG